MQTTASLTQLFPAAGSLPDPPPTPQMCHLQLNFSSSVTAPVAPIYLLLTGEETFYMLHCFTCYITFKSRSAMSQQTRMRKPQSVKASIWMAEDKRRVPWHKGKGLWLGSHRWAASRWQSPYFPRCPGHNYKREECLGSFYALPVLSRANMCIAWLYKWYKISSFHPDVKAHPHSLRRATSRLTSTSPRADWLESELK